jgi:hypothetical protein
VTRSLPRASGRPVGRRRAIRALVAGTLATAVTGLSLYGGPLPVAAAAAGTAHAGTPPRGVPASAPAAAPTPTVTSAAANPVTVTLTGVGPTIARPGEPVVVTGTLRNTSPTVIDTATVHARLSTRGLQTRSGVQGWARGDTPEVAGSVVASQDLPDPLPTGGTASFRLTIPAGAVRNGEGFAALPLAVDVGAGQATVGEARTFLPWFYKKEFVAPLALTTVVPLTLDPDPALFTAPGADRSAAWTKAIGPDSRLQSVIAGTADAPVTWAIDPAILGPSADGAAGTAGGTSGGSGAARPPGPTSRGLQPADAVPRLTAALTSRLAAASTGHDLWALPYADPDIATAPSDPTVGGLLARPQTLGTALRRQVRSDIAWPVDNRLPAQREADLRQSFPGLTAGVVSTSGLTLDPGYSGDAARKSSDGLPLLASDDQLSGILAATSDGASGASTVQRFLAETLALMKESPGRERSVLVTAPRDFAGNRSVLTSLFAAVADAPWLRATPSSSLLYAAVDAQGEPAPDTTEVAGEAEPPASMRSPLTTQRLADIIRTKRDVDGAASILSGAKATQFAATWGESQDELVSSRWRGHPRSWSRLARMAPAAVHDLTKGVRVLVAPGTVKFLAEDGVLQFIVVNDLDETVDDVRLRLTSDSRRLRINHQPRPLRIGPGSRTTVKVRVTAVAPGLVPISADLSTPNGTRLGRNAQVKVEVRPISVKVFWGLGGVFALILVVGIYRSLRRPGRPKPDLDLAQENPLA